MKDVYLLNRRVFLRRLSALAGSSVAVSSMPWLSVFDPKHAVGRAASDRVRLGVIGVGDRGHALALHIKELEQAANVELAAFCDDYEPNFQRALETTEGRAQGFYDYRELLEMDDLDGVIIATPLHEHAQMTVDAFDAGMHVFCEKAMARTLADTKRMYDAYEQSGGIMLIGHQRLFNPIYLEAIERIRRGDLGPITQIRAFWHRNNDWRREVPPGRPDLERKINWRHYEEYSAGLITELGSHHFQVANWVKDSQPVSVVGKGVINYWKDGREVYDNLACVFLYPDDTVFIYDSMISNKHYGLQVQVMGDTGTMELETNKLYWEDPPEPPAVEQLVEDIENDEFDTIPIGGATWIPEIQSEYAGEYISADYEMDDTGLAVEGFIRFIREGRPQPMMALEGYRASVWSMLAEQSIKEGREVTLPAEYRR